MLVSTTKKRPDILTDIVAESTARELPIRFHVFGASVLGEADEFHEDLARMSTLGVAIQGPYTTFADLPPERFDAFLMTSQYEGMPLTLLDAMANGISRRGGCCRWGAGDLDATTGCPVIPFDDVNAYVDASPGCSQIPTRPRRGRCRPGIASPERTHGRSTRKRSPACQATCEHTYGRAMRDGLAINYVVAAIARATPSYRRDFTVINSMAALRRAVGRQLGVERPPAADVSSADLIRFSTRLPESLTSAERASLEEQASELDPWLPGPFPTRRRSSCRWGMAQRPAMDRHDRHRARGPVRQASTRRRLQRRI